ncbi:unnamed protein product [Urochloa decumbens]|uniref:Uncharacterized protein n=1 Tax=Urochloa decumbens TaxID=240449 RepID=A0ABC9AHG8_9POAL
MQLASCEFFGAAAARRPGAAASWSGRRPSLTTAAPALTVTKRKPTAVRCHRSSSSRRDDAEFSCGGGGRLVDEGMLVLRRRIHEMRAAERGWEPPEEWAAWEKEWYGTYDADVCELLAALQGFLVSSRPGVGVGILAVLALAVPASAFVLVTHLLDASRAVVSNLHH